MSATADASPKRGSHFTNTPLYALNIPSSPIVIAVLTVSSAFANDADGLKGKRATQVVKDLNQEVICP